jgi:DMSO/TMAO reductase YedYZ molybdopterin-dependent catalytic subunit
VGADGYSAFVSMDMVLGGNNFLAYEWEGEPVPIFHGFPVRAVFPVLEGNKWVKWLIEIEVN